MVRPICVCRIRLVTLSRSFRPLCFLRQVSRLRFCFQLCCLCLAIAPWLELGRNGLRGGAILADHRERTTNLRNVASCFNFAERLPGENVIMVAWDTDDSKSRS